MKVQFVSNLGSRDAQELGLNYTECTGGSVHDIPEGKTLESLKAGGFVREVKSSPAAVPAPPVAETEVEPDKKRK